MGLGALVTVLGAQFLRKYLPRQYFALSDVVYGIDSRVTWTGVAARFSIPLVVGTAVAAAAPEEPMAVAAAAGFLGALLLVWPNLLRPEFVHWPLLERRRELYLVYGMFVGAYTLIALSGGFLGRVGQGAIDRNLLAAAADGARLLITSVISSLIAAILVYFFTRQVRRVERK